MIDAHVVQAGHLHTFPSRGGGGRGGVALAAGHAFVLFWKKKKRGEREGTHLS